MNICLVVRRLGPGGTERQLIELSRSLAEHGHSVSVIEYYAGGLFTPSLLEIPTVRHVCLDKRGRYTGVSFLNKLLAAIKQTSPDAIYAYLPSVTTPLLLLRKFGLLRAPLVVNIRRGEPLTEGDRFSLFMMYLEWKLLGAARHIVFNSFHARGAFSLSEGLEDKISVISNGINVKEFYFDSVGRQQLRANYGIQAEDVLIGCVARFDRLKRHELLIKSLSQLESHFKLAFVSRGGDEQYESELRELAASYGDRVKWLPASNEMRPFYSALDVFGFCSASEGFPNAIAEAMACERVCVSTDCGDSKRILGDTGIIVEPVVEQVSAGIKKALKDREKGALARRRVQEHFTIDNLREQIVALTHTVANER